MRIINPSVEIIKESDPLKKIELCGRVCYKSEDRITEDSAIKFIQNIIKRGHESVLEHYSIRLVTDFLPIPSSKHIRSENYIASGNVRAWRDYLRFGTPTARAAGNMLAHLYPALFTDLINVDIDTLVIGSFHSLETPDYLTVRFICDRGVSHELVRHRVASFSQESTRYCNYSGEMTFIKPCFDWARSIPVGVWDAADYAAMAQMEIGPEHYWMWAMDTATHHYNLLTQKGLPPQEARSVLPNSLKTEVVMTATYAEWEAILKLRLAPAAHPQMRQVMQMLVSLPDFPEELKLGLK